MYQFLTVLPNYNPILLFMDFDNALLASNAVLIE